MQFISRKTLKGLMAGSLFSLQVMVPVQVTNPIPSQQVIEPVQLAKEAVVAKPAKAAKKSKSIAAPDFREADSLYKSLELSKKGLSKPAFRYAWKGYKRLLAKGKLRRSDVLSICDFSQSSRRKRLYVIDMQQHQLLMQTYVAHGRNSGSEFARNFSNLPESHQSSLGFYITRSTYFGEHGLSLKIDGVERGINDKASARNIVVHGSDYVGTSFLRSNKMIGRSFGCPAVPKEQAPKIIQTIKQGTCLFIYHPNKKYIHTSKILNV